MQNPNAPGGDKPKPIELTNDDGIPPPSNKLREPLGGEITTQASRVLLKFGGARRLAAFLRAGGHDVHPITVYKWAYPKERGGTGGVIPSKHLGPVLDAARLEGIILDADDLDPRPRAAAYRPKHAWEVEEDARRSAAKAKRDAKRDAKKALEASGGVNSADEG